MRIRFFCLLVCFFERIAIATGEKKEADRRKKNFSYSKLLFANKSIHECDHWFVAHLSCNFTKMRKAPARMPRLYIFCSCFLSQIGFQCIAIVGFPESSNGPFFDLAYSLTGEAVQVTNFFQCQRFVVVKPIVGR